MNTTSPHWNSHRLAREASQGVCINESQKSLSLFNWLRKLCPTGIVCQTQLHLQTLAVSTLQQDKQKVFSPCPQNLSQNSLFHTIFWLIIAPFSVLFIVVSRARERERHTHRKRQTERERDCVCMCVCVCVSTDLDLGWLFISLLNV